MKEYNDVELNKLISEGKEATIRLGYMKTKKQNNEKKELLILRRNRWSLIRKRATELCLTEAELNDIYTYVVLN